MMDEELVEFNKEYLNLGPQYQIPNPELGPLEKRVSATYVDGLLSGEISLEDGEYWFTEPAGAWWHHNLHGMNRLDPVLGVVCTIVHACAKAQH